MNTAHEERKFETDQTPTWCPGCGDFAIWRSLKLALAEANKEPHECVVVFDIGCSGNMADKIKVYGFHGLHGRAIPVAEGIKLANHEMPVLVVAGDGGGYGEGLGHLLHSIRGNHDITYIVHDNGVYGLTKGQTAPTSEQGFKSSSTPEGVIERPLNALGLALTAGATFVGRGFAAEGEHLTTLLKQAMNHKGFALLDVFQPCVTFNHVNTYEWYRERVYKIEETKHDVKDWNKALAITLEEDKIPIGVLYQDESRPAYHEKEPQLTKSSLVNASVEGADIVPLCEEYF